MARGDYGPEVKAAISEKKPSTKKGPPKRSSKPDTPADMARDKQRGIPEGSPEDLAIDARQPSGVGQMPPRQGQMPPHPPAPGGANPVHAAMATSIAHAILGGGKGGY